MDVFVDLSKYKIEKKIHTSNFSRTTLVSDKNSGELKVMKTIFYVLNDETRQKQFLTNFYDLNLSNYPTLLPYQFFSFSINSTFHPSIIFNYYKNGSLYDCCKKLSNTQKMIVLVGIVEGMRYIHFNSQYHGCLEPGNIIIDNDFHPLICSYGLSDLSDSVGFDVFRSPFSLPNVIPATNYDSLNNFKSKEYIQMKQADDVFAFAMVLYFVLTNETPLQKRCANCQQRIEMFLRGFRPQLPSWVPCDLANLEYECWQADGKKRPSFKEISRRLRTCTSILPPGIDISQVSTYLRSLADPEERKIILNQNKNEDSKTVQNESNEKQESANESIKINNDDNSNNEIVQIPNENSSQNIELNSNIDLSSQEKSQNSSQNNSQRRKLFLREDNSDNSDIEIINANENPTKSSPPKKISIDIKSDSSDDQPSFSNNQNENENSDNFDLDFGLSSTKQSNIVIQSQKTKTSPQKNHFSISDSDSYLGSDFDSDSNSKSEDESSRIIEDAKQLSPEMHDYFKEQTKEGKELIKNGQIEAGVVKIKNAAESSYRGALLAYGRLFECGVGVSQNMKEASVLYGKASSMGSNNAKANYARFAMKGLGGVEHNSIAGTQLLEKAAKDQLQKWQKLPNLSHQVDMKTGKNKKKQSQVNNLENTLKYGLFNTKTEAIYCYAKILHKKAKNKNDSDLLNQALKFVQPAAEKDFNIKAMNLFGEIILELGKTKQYSKAAKFFKIAADEGNRKAQFNYGNCRKEGLGVSVNENEAVKYFKMSADQGYPNGLNEYGNALQEGIGIEQDVMEAKKFIKMAADLGCTDAQYNYVMMLQMGIGFNSENEDEKKAADREIMEYLRKASDSNYVDAMILYSQLLMKDLDALDEDERLEKLKTAKACLKRILNIASDDDVCARAEELLSDVKDMINNL